MCIKSVLQGARQNVVIKGASLSLANDGCAVNSLSDIRYIMGLWYIWESI